ncbi:MAG: hypothetical protein ACRDJH_22465 [Thermomicrobiales bacterium]
MARDRVATLSQGEVAAALRQQWRALRSVMVLIYTPVVIAFAVVVAIRIGTGIAIATFTRDPLAFTEIPVYTGVLSTLGVVIWSAAAAVCLLSYAVIRNRAAGGASPHFLLAGGLVTVLLLLDDAFMLHEVVFPEHLGVSQKVVYAAHAAVLLWFLVWFRSTILHTDFLLLALALAGFGFSVGTDLTARSTPFAGLYVFEDGAKLFGIVSWAAYFVMVSAQRVGGEVGGQQSD